MDIHQHNLIAQKTGRYFSLGTPGPAIQYTWMVLHGYGQLANYFLKSFQPITGEDNYFLSPEGQSRFYLDPNYQRVGASWMTKEDRHVDIRDQMEWLATFKKAAVEKKELLNSKKILLGFSQGTATAWRWLHSGGIQPDALVIWAGSIPLELTPKMVARLKTLPVWVLYATRDQFIPTKLAEERIAQMEDKIPNFRVIQFDDSHRINEDALMQLDREIRELI